MNWIQNLRISPTLLAFCLGSGFGVGVEVSRQSIPFTHDLKALKSSLNIPTDAKPETIRVPEKVLKARLSRASKDNRVEPFHLRVPASMSERKIYSKEIARPGQARAVYRQLDSIIKDLDQQNLAKGQIKVPLNESFSDKIRMDRATEELESQHYEVRISSERVSSRSMRDLYEQVQGFLAPKELSRLRKAIREKRNLSLAEYFLPSFARTTLKQYLVFRGPNCFHAALSFHGEDLAKSKYINVKEEQGYHRAMINYDELWRAIQSHFYEINPAHAELKYGDMIVFFDVADPDPAKLHFRWIRHAATYLFGPYTFSKGSKSADTPYTIKTLEQEWQTWSALSQRMGVKVYRRSSFQSSPVPSKNLESWMY